MDEWMDVKGMWMSMIFREREREREVLI